MTGENDIAPSGTRGGGCATGGGGRATGGGGVPPNGTRGGGGATGGGGVAPGGTGGATMFHSAPYDPFITEVEAWQKKHMPMITLN